MHIGENENKKSFRGVRSLTIILILSVVCGFVALFVQYKYVLPIYDKIELPKPPEIVFYPNAKMSFGLISDVHALAKGKNGNYVLSPKYKFTTEEFTKTMRDDFKPDFMVANGDIIDGTYQESEEGMAVLGMVKNIFDKAKIPTYWAIGNHELRSISDEQWLSALGIDYLDKSFIVGDYKIILMDSQYSAGGRNEGNNDETPGRILFSNDQKAWLEHELSTTRKIPVVFLHNPPFDYIGAKPCGASTEEANYMQNLFARYHVAAVFSGHIEKKFHKRIDGVDYYVIPGLQKSGEYFGSFAEVKMVRRHAEVNLLYRDIAGNEKLEKVE